MKFIYTCFLLFISFSINAQVIAEDLNFTSDEEQGFVLNYKRSQTFDLLYLIDVHNENRLTRNAYKKAFYLFLDNLEGKIRKKKPAKKVSFIYDKIYDKYLKTYALNPVFSDIFVSNQYNCVTASALYAIAFDYLEIPYEIHEMPTYVYLVVYPSANKILLETTTADGGYIVSNQQVEIYKRYLFDNNLATKDEVDNLSDEQFFQKYLSDNSISLKNLIGIQYYNNSIKAHENKDFDYALSQIEKGQFLHPKDYLRTWTNVILFEYLYKEYNNIPLDKTCLLLGKVSRYNPKDDIYQQRILEIFSSFIDDHFDKQDGVRKIEKFSKCLNDKIINDSISNEIEYMTKVVSAEHSYNTLKFQKALMLISSIYTYRSNENLQLFISDCLGRHFSNISNANDGLDSLKKYETIFPFIKTDPQIQSYGIWCYSKLIHKAYYLNEADEGKRYYKAFKAKYAVDNKKMLYHDEFIGSLFGEMSAYYVRQKDYKKAKAVLREGLEYNSESLILLRKLKLLEDY